MIICVTRNNLELTKKCVPTLLNQCNGASDVLVLDNASTDGTVQWLRTQVVRYVMYARQKSLAGVWNDGLTHAWRMGYKRALVVNNDVELRDDTYTRLSNQFIFTSSRKMMICSGVSVREMPEQDGKKVPRTMSTRPHPDFSCFMISRDGYMRVGPFDEQFEGAYCEDNDYHVRVVKAGLSAVCVDVPFLHHGAQTVKRADPEEKERITRLAEENRKRFWRKWGCWPGSKQYEELFSAEAGK